MTSFLKRFAKKITPPLIWDASKLLLSANIESGRPFTGPFADWSSALQTSDTWDEPVITEKTLEMSLKVKNGEIEFQQDTVPQDRIIYSETILAFLALVAQENSGQIDLVDFGGSLATNYFQNRRIVYSAAAARGLRWLIVERPDIARLGNEHFANDHLRFYDKVETLVFSESMPRSVLFNGSLQYIEQPEEALKEVLDCGATVIAFDRLLTSSHTHDEIYVQHPNPERYYDASYPVWVFSQETFKKRMKEHGLKLVGEFLQAPSGDFRHIGMLFVRHVGSDDDAPNW